jgi:hypothetical protein
MTGMTMIDELHGAWLAASEVLRRSVGVEQADIPLKRFVEIASQDGGTRNSAIGLITAGLDDGTPWEAVAYAFHVLRWPELQSALEDRRAAWLSDPRRQNIWAHLHDAFNPAWEDREMYPSLSGRVS